MRFARSTGRGQLRLFVSVLAALVAACGGRKVTPDELRTRVTAAIPQGSSPVRVASLLDSLGIEHAGYDSLRHETLAIVRETSKTFFVKGSVQLVFTFDATPALSAIVAKQVYTGP